MDTLLPSELWPLVSSLDEGSGLGGSPLGRRALGADGGGFGRDVLEAGEVVGRGAISMARWETAVLHVALLPLKSQMGE